MPSTVDKIKLARHQDKRARFNDEQVKKMRELYAEGCTQKEIADRYDTHQSTVSYIVSERAHKHLAEYRKTNPPKRRTKEEAKLYMRNLRKYKRTLLKGGGEG